MSDPGPAMPQRFWRGGAGNLAVHAASALLDHKRTGDREIDAAFFARDCYYMTENIL